MSRPPQGPGGRGGRGLPKRAIKDFWRRHAPDIAQRWKAVRGAIEVEAPGPSGLWNVRVPNTQTLLTEAHDVMFAVRAFWRELYDKRPVDLPGFQALARPSSLSPAVTAISIYGPPRCGCSARSRNGRRRTMR